MNIFLLINIRFKENGDSLPLDLGIGEAALVVLESRDITGIIVIICVAAALLGAGSATTVAIMKKRKNKK